MLIIGLLSYNKGHSCTHNLHSCTKKIEILSRNFLANIITILHLYSVIIWG